MITSAKLAADIATKTLRRARKTAITLGFDTQSSRADVIRVIPPKIVELVAINACFAVKTWRSNDGFLGDGSFQAGIRATKLRPGKDQGTCVLTGATTERFEILKWFYIEANDDSGYDAATEGHCCVRGWEQWLSCLVDERRSLCRPVGRALGVRRVSVSAGGDHLGCALVSSLWTVLP